MKYFYIFGELWHCDTVFNYLAIDYDGDVYLYYDKPVRTTNNGRHAWYSERFDDYCTYLGNINFDEDYEPLWDNGWCNSLTRLTRSVE